MTKKIWGIDREIVVLGVVSFLTDISSEMIFSVLSIFMTVILRASTAALGLIEGFADFSASALDFVAGYLSDKTGKRKVFAVFGYSFSTLAKACLIVAQGIASVGIFRVIERLGKSIRGPPRDAMISSIAAPSKRGISFGFHKMLDKAGAILGPLITYFILDNFGQTAQVFRLLFMIAVVPAVLSVLLLMIGVKDHPVKKQPHMRLMKTYGALNKSYKHYVKTAGLFSIAYFSFAFLLIKAYAAGFAIKDVALLYALFNISFVVFATPIGFLGDKIGRRWIILAEYLLYFFMNIGFMLSTTKNAVIWMFVVYGVFYAIDESQTKAYITDISDKKSRATAIGIYNFVTGMLYIPASLLAGFLWSINPAYTFASAGIISLMSAVYFIFE